MWIAIGVASVLAGVAMAVIGVRRWRESDTMEKVIVLSIAGILVLVGVAGAGATVEQRQENRAARSHFAEVTRLLEAGQPSEAMTLLLETVKDHPDANSVDDDAELAAILRAFPAPVLAAGGLEAASVLPDFQMARVRALCDEAILTTHPDGPEALDARTRLLGVLGIGAAAYEWHGWRESDIEAARRGLATVTDPAFIRQLTLVVRAGDAGDSAARVLASLGEPGVRALAELVKGPEPAARESAVYALMWAEGDLAAATFVSLLDSEDPVTRQLAARTAVDAFEDSAPRSDEVERELKDRLTDPAIALGAVEFAVSEGRDETIGAIIEGLFAYGDIGDANVLLNCGNEKLEDAAEKWATEHGYDIEKVPGEPEHKWGD
jgi:hypothetical protein